MNVKRGIKDWSRAFWANASIWGNDWSFGQRSSNLRSAKWTV